jgi:hypothetical protein
MHTLTDLQVFALLAASPAAARHERDLAREQCFWLERGMGVFPEHVVTLRNAFARVCGLPAREPGDEMPIVMALAWGDVERLLIPREQIDRTLAALASASCTTGSIADRVEALVAEVLELRANAEALLRAEVGPESERPTVDADGASICPCGVSCAFHDAGGSIPVSYKRPDGRCPHCPETCKAHSDLATLAAAVSCSRDVPAKPLSYCAGPSCPGYPYAASSLAHPPSCNEPR